jgi:hypothetical protein
MSPLIRAFLLLQAGQITGQVAAAVVQARLDPVGATPKEGEERQTVLPIGGGLSRVDDVIMIGGSAGSMYLAATQKMSGEARLFVVGMAMGFSAPVTQSIATAVSQKIAA